MKSQRPGMNLTFPTSVTANILNEKQLQQDLAAGHDYIDLIRLVLFGKEKEVYICLISSLIKLIFQLP